MADNDGRLLDHEYDGIQELDNDLPRWWLWMFYASIAIAVVYMLYFHVLNIGYLSADEYNREMDPGYIRVQDHEPTYFGIVPRYRSPLAAVHGDIAPADVSVSGGTLVPFSRESDTTTYLAPVDDASLASGKNTYLMNCSSCHGKLGEGGIGPNLTDDYWLHGDDFSSVVKSVRYGYPAKGMVPWLGTLQPDEILRASSFVMTLRGTNPPNPKAPEGELVSE